MVLVFLALKVLKRILSRRVRVWVKGTETDLDDLVVDLFGRTWYLFLVAVSIYIGSLVLTLPTVESGIRTVLVMLFLIQAALWGGGVINYLVSRQVKEQSKKSGTAAATVNANLLKMVVEILCTLELL